MTVQKTSKGAIAFKTVDAAGKFVVLENTSPTGARAKVSTVVT